MNIKNIQGLQILDSRGNPTVKAFVELENGIIGSASVPSGASTGSHEALELRDGNKEYGGKGVMKAIEHINTTISNALRGMQIDNLEKLDTAMLLLDTSPQKSTIGANAMLAVSMALARTLSLYQNQPLWKTLHAQYFASYKKGFPRLLINVINGGAHANWTVDFQEYMFIPKSQSPKDAVRQASEIFHALRLLLIEKGTSVGVGDEGGFAPILSNNAEGFTLISEAIKKAGYSRENTDLGTDIAASEFYKDGTYILKRDNKTLTSKELKDYYSDLDTQHHLLLMEDPFFEDDMESFADLTQTFGSSHIIVGDDFYATNSERISRGIENKATNAVLIKLNQIGSVFETVQAIRMTKEAGWNVIISHRSGETEDPFIADLAVACGADFIKTGSMSRSERLAKYNRLIEIEAREFLK